MSLREYSYATRGPKRRAAPRCWYCGARATMLDVHNAKPACKRCGARTRSRTVKAFRGALADCAKALGHPALIRFHGEGCAGVDLRRLRFLLSRVVRRGGKIVVLAKGEPLQAPREPRPREPRPRWPGLYTFEGQRALRALFAATGQPIRVIERYIVGAPVAQAPRITLDAACKKLKLSRAKLAALKPAGRPSATTKPRRKKKSQLSAIIRFDERGAYRTDPAGARYYIEAIKHAPTAEERARLKNDGFAFLYDSRDGFWTLRKNPP